MATLLVIVGPSAATTCSASLILLESIVTLVDGIVRQVHEQVVDVGRLWPHVGLGGEAGNTFVMYVYAHWVDSIEQHVESQVILEVVN